MSAMTSFSGQVPSPEELSGPSNTPNEPETNSHGSHVSDSTEEDSLDKSSALASCLHQPVNRYTFNASQTCKTCQTVNLAIIALQRHETTLRVRAAHKLQSARRDLPTLYLDAMHENTKSDHTINEDGTITSHSNPAEKAAKMKQFRKYNRFFEMWCERLGLDPEGTWSLWAENQVEEIDNEDGGVRLDDTLESGEGATIGIAEAINSIRRRNRDLGF